MIDMKSWNVIVVGGGVVGLCAARELAQHGHDVQLLERHVIGERGTDGAATAASMGVLTAPRRRRSPFGQLQQLGFRMYPELAACLERETGSNGAFDPCGGLYLAVDDSRAERAVAGYTAIGLAARWMGRDELRERIPAISPEFAGAVWVEDEAVVHPVALLQALRDSAEMLGVRVRDGLGAVRVATGVATDVPRVRLADGEELRADRIVLAVGAWANEILDPPPTPPVPLAPIRGQVLELSVPQAPRESLHFSFADLPGSYHLLQKDDGAAWMGSTVEDVGFDTTTTAAAEAELRQATARLFPGLGRAELRVAWSGLRPQATRRGGPILAPLAATPQVWLAVGHYRSGILLAPSSARVLVAKMHHAAGLEPEGDVAPELLDAFGW